jgi:hypothetical protein
MFFPFVAVSRFDEMPREKNMQIGYRDRRIAELEAERRILWDKICRLGIGAPVFEGTNPLGYGDPRQAATGPVIAGSGDVHPAIPKAAVITDSGHVDIGATENPGNQASAPASFLPHRPSMIMRRMDRLAEERWLRKVRPAKAAERQRDEVMTELNAAHMDGVKAALPNK